MNRPETWTRPFILLAAVLLALSPSLSLAQSPGRVRNLRIIRENPGGANDRLVAQWNPPADGNVNQYIFRRAYTYSSTPNQTSWSSARHLSGTTEVIGSTPFTGDGGWLHVRVEVAILFNGVVGGSVYATLRCVSNDAAASAACQRARRSRGSGSRSDSGTKPLVSVSPARPVVHTCMTMTGAGIGIQVSSPFGLEGGIQCQVVDGGGVGVASIVDAGFVAAVDVWGSNIQLAEICFDRQGESFIFLDAAHAPRTLSSLPASRKAGMVCATIDRPGTVVLMPLTAYAVGLSPLGVDAAASAAPAPVAAEGQCLVMTTGYLNHREVAPKGQVYAVIPKHTSVVAVARTEYWYRVHWQGKLGWIYAQFVEPVGECNLRF